MGRLLGRRRGFAAALAVVALALAACVPEPPAPPAATAAAPSPPPPPPLPSAPDGASTGPRIMEASADPFIVSVDPIHCVDPAPAPPEPEPEPPTTTTTVAPQPVPEPEPDPASTASTTTTSVPPSTTTTSAPSTTLPQGLPEGIPSACYYAYTTSFWFFLVPVWRSTDLVSWTHVITDTVRGSALAGLAPWSEFGHHWAPAVLELPDPADPAASRFVLWYTARDRASGKQCLGVATSSSPAGPFVDDATSPAYCQPHLGGTIDPEPFVDVDGSLYLLYKSEGVAFAARTALWASRLSADGTQVVPGTERMLLEVDPTGWEEPIVEAPSMIRVDGRLHLFYSAYWWPTDDYKVGVATCDTPLGPCRRTYSTPVLATRGAMRGPGGQSLFRAPDGAWQMVFHAWSDHALLGDERRLRILPVTFPDGNPKVG